MKGLIVPACVAAASAFALSSTSVSASSPPAADVVTVFSASQADAGKVAFGKACASCHMPDLSGNADAPPLAGPNFMSVWGKRTTKDLFDYVSATMPPGGASTSRETYVSIVAHLLRSNGAVAGTDELTATTAARIDALVRP